MKISILGSGSWGTSLAKVLDENGHDVLLWHYKDDFVQRINQNHIHPFLPEVKLSTKLHFTSSIDEICNYCELLVSAVPCQSLRSVLDQFPENWNKLILSVSKGIENKTGMRMSEVISETLKIDFRVPSNLENNQEEYEFLKKLDADLAIVAAYGQIIPKNFLDLTKKGFINIHGSVLPKWRGAAPIQRAIMNLDNETGISLSLIHI